MSDDWDTVVKIGSKAGPSGGGGPREKTIRGKSQLNAAMRTGNILATEKKYSSANASSSSGSGQFLTKVDRSDDIVKPKTGNKDVGSFITRTRETKKWDRAELAKQSGVNAGILAEYEKGTKPLPQDDCNKLERALGVYVRGALQGQPKVKQFKRQLKAAEGK